MGKKQPKTPAAPDPAQTAAAQTASNQQTALWNSALNNVNQVTPYGNLSWTLNQITGPDGKLIPQWSSVINLSPEQQKILDSQNRQDIALGSLGEAQIGRIGESVSTPYSYSGLGELEDYATAAENSLYSRLNPQFDRDEESMRTRLINQGIGQGSQAYQREMESFNQMKNDARMQAVLAGQQYALTGRNQEIMEYDAQRNAPLNEYIGLTSGTQVTNPQFSGGGYGGAGQVDYAGMVNQNYQNQMGQYNARQAQANNQSSSMSKLFGLGGSMIGGPVGGFVGSAVGSLFSDIRLKENIQYIGESKGFPVYKFNYINIPEKTYIGVMAQDVREIMPEAISESEGFMKVDYGMIGLEMQEVV